MYNTGKFLQFIGMLIIPLTTIAQESGIVKVDSRRVVIDRNELSIELILLGNNLDIQPDGFYRIDISLENGENILPLPAVIYTNTSHYHYDNERKILYSTKINDVQAVDIYRLIKGVNKYSIYWTPYDATVPYESWMRDAVVKVRCISQCPKNKDVLIKEEIMRAEL